MTNWKLGQSRNPNGRPRRGYSVAGLAKAIARERVEFTDRGPYPMIAEVENAVETATYSRLERLLRVLWTMALDGDLGAIRCLLEYMEGRPARQVAETAGKPGDEVLTADDLASQRPLSPEEAEAWRAARKQASKFGKSG